MNQFLAMTRKTVVDQAYQAAIPEVPEVPAVFDDSDPPVEISPAIPAIPAVPEVPLITHDEPDAFYIENSAAQIALNLAADADGTGPGIDYYYITANGAQLNVAVQPVNLKGGARGQAPAREIVEVQAGGVDVGSAVREV